MGTPAFAATSLNLLLKCDHEIVGVVTRPDARSGRGLKTTFSEVKQLAVDRGLVIHQPTRVRGEEFFEMVRSLAPEIIVVVAYGRILPERILDIPSRGSINVHASLLPCYRGDEPLASWRVEPAEHERVIVDRHLLAAALRTHVPDPDSPIVAGGDYSITLRAALVGQITLRTQPRPIPSRATRLKIKRDRP